MADMLVNLYAQSNANQHHPSAAEGVLIKRALAVDTAVITAFVRDHFSAESKGWVDECAVTLKRQPVSCFIAVEQGRPIGFACYDATAKGMVGPLGVDAAYRNRGIATLLLNHCFEAMKSEGYAYAVIGWVSSTEFYQKVCGAMEIPGSEPGVYSRMLSHNGD
jgi:GNAT superfamily N-acetyltransferase